jgi:AcrR family transcriptional regulator
MTRIPETPDRIRDALVEMVGEEGASRATLENLLERAGLNREEFDRLYPSFEACVTEVWQQIITFEFWPRSDAAFRRGRSWREGIRLQAWDLLRFVEEDLDRIRYLVETSFTTELVQANRDVEMSRIADYFHRGRLEREDGAEVPRATAEALIGAIWNGIAQNIQPPVDREALRNGTPLMLYMTMRPTWARRRPPRSCGEGPRTSSATNAASSSRK